MKSDASEFRIVLKDNAELAEEFSQLKPGDNEVEIRIRVQINNLDENEIAGMIDGARLEKAPDRKETPHNAVEIIGGEVGGPPAASDSVTNIEQSEISPAALI